MRDGARRLAPKSSRARRRHLDESVCALADLTPRLALDMQISIMARLASRRPLLILVLLFYAALAETVVEDACADLCDFFSGCAPVDDALYDAFCPAQYYAVAFLCFVSSIALCVAAALLAANEEPPRSPRRPQ